MGCAGMADILQVERNRFAMDPTIGESIRKASGSGFHWRASAALIASTPTSGSGSRHELRPVRGTSWHAYSL